MNVKSQCYPSGIRLIVVSVFGSMGAKQPTGPCCGALVRRGSIALATCQVEMTRELPLLIPVIDTVVGNPHIARVGSMP
ncbi:hypothetical protein AAHA92_25754 [Salvia divinorum]|uniref:Bifunctional inhibitor/plant lipid transfer protein/seed storage helical domain-containing protein n=1 Tax=Salvia divinorum TaxID=28513 RepID=A0ABD1GBN6_SALDI